MSALLRHSKMWLPIRFTSKGRRTSGAHENRVTCPFADGEGEQAKQEIYSELGPILQHRVCLDEGDICSLPDSSASTSPSTNGSAIPHFCGMSRTCGVCTTGVAGNHVIPFKVCRAHVSRCAVLRPRVGSNVFRFTRAVGDNRPAVVRSVAKAEENLSTDVTSEMALSKMGLIGLAVMGQNLALNVAEKGFPISVFNRSYEKTEAAVGRAKKEGLGEKLVGFESMADFVASLERPRRIVILVKAGAPVDATIDALLEHVEPGDIIVDGGNEWYENTERRAKKVEAKGVLYMGMGVSGGEEGARNGPSMMPGGSKEGYKHLEPIVQKVAAQVDDGPCVMYIGEGGSGNFVKMVHNGIEYGDMQLISEAYDVLKTLGGLTNPELAEVFAEWNSTDLKSFLVEISAIILAKADDKGEGFLLDKIMDKTGSKGTGKWTVQQAADLSVAAPTITASLDGRYMSALKDERVAAAEFFAPLGLGEPTAIPGVDKAALIADVKSALYASKVVSYAQGMNIIKAKSTEQNWGVDLGGLARIWKGGCIIRAQFLDRIKQAYDRNAELANLLVDPEFAKEIAEREASWRRVIQMAVANGVAVPGMTASLGYFDTYRRARLPANLVQAQRDFFGSHTYQRTDGDGWFHTVWDESFGSADSITTTGYNQ